MPDSVSPSGLIGKDVQLRDAHKRVLGTLELTVNYELPGMVYARTLRSPYPHALIRSIDKSEAEAQPGVLAVISGADLEADERLNPYYGGQRVDQPVLAIGKVRHHGEAVAMVVAETEEQAQRAVSLMDVEYEELSYVTDPVEAMVPGAPAVHDEYLDNECGVWKIRHGDIEAGWAQSDRIYEDVYTSPTAHHVPMEPHVSVATYDPEAGLNVYASTQAPYMVQSDLCHIFGLPEERVRVRTHNLGGGYGAKGGSKIEPMVACAAYFMRRPVKMTLTREEVFFTIGKHSAHIRIRTGVKSDGTLVARHVEVVWNAGAYANSSIRGSQQGMARAPGPYHIPHVWVDSTARYTNTVPTGPFRGAMTSQVCWAYESQLDDIAADLGIDPVEIRRRNLLRDGSVYATGEEMHDTHFVDLLEEVAQGIEWDQPSPTAPPGRARGKGVGVLIKSTITPSRSEAKLRLTPNGCVQLLSSSVEMGQGANTILSQMAADYLMLPLEQIEQPFPDTAITPYDLTTSSSRTTYSMGFALREAAGKMHRRLAELAADQLEVSPGDIRHSGGSVLAVGSPDRSLSYAEVITRAGLAELLVEGVFQSEGGLDPETGQGRHTVHWHEGAVGVEVEVDLETGRIEVLRCHGASYAGRIVNPVRVRQQNEGNIIFGLGPALFEEILFDNGQMVNPNLSDYMIPSIMDIPRRLSSRSIESEGPNTDIHGVGEMTLPAVAPAIGNALLHATGVRIRELPMSAERVLHALLDAGKKQQTEATR